MEKTGLKNKLLVKFIATNEFQVKLRSSKLMSDKEESYQDISSTLKNDNSKCEVMNYDIR